MDNKKRDFLLEDKFIEWRLLPTEELNSFWEEFRLNNPELIQDLDKAIEEFDAISFETSRLTEREKQEILSIISKKANKRKRIKTFIQATSTIAAIAIIGLFITFLFNNNQNNEYTLDNTIIGQTLPEEDIYIISGDSKTKLANNSNLELTKDKKAIVKDSTQEDKEVVLAKATMNRLVVPYGKRSNIVLSDGSKIWINSGTQLDFPTDFVGNKREIKVNGEIYIEVVNDNKKPFIVNAGKMAIQVYGTSFNVTAYDDEEISSVVLVEGSVGVTTPGYESTVLSPNEKLDLSSGGISKEVVDVSEYISWTRDVLEFDETPISEVLSKIGRYYNVQFENSPDIRLNEQTCSGKLFLSNNLDSVMISISVLSSTEYERNNNIIHIRKK